MRAGPRGREQAILTCPSTHSDSPVSASLCCPIPPLPRNSACHTRGVRVMKARAISRQGERLPGTLTAGPLPGMPLQERRAQSPAAAKAALQSRPSQPGAGHWAATAG
jgi:hypothetical protein